MSRRNGTSTRVLVEGAHQARPHQTPVHLIRQVIHLAGHDTARGYRKRIARATGLDLAQVDRILRAGNGVRAALRGWRP